MTLLSYREPCRDTTEVDTLTKTCPYVPNGTRIRLRHDGADLEHFGLRPQDYALYLGRFSPEKNCHLLIEAFERLRTPMKLVLAGGSSYTDEYMLSLRKHQSERIRLLDWLSGNALEEVLTNALYLFCPRISKGSHLLCWTPWEQVCACSRVMLRKTSRLRETPVLRSSEEKLMTVPACWNSFCRVLYCAKLRVNSLEHEFARIICGRTSRAR